MEQHASAEPRAATTAVVLLAAVALGVGAAIAVADRLELDPRSRERPRSGVAGRPAHEQRRDEPAGPGAAKLDPVATGQPERWTGDAAGLPGGDEMLAGGRAPAAATTVALDGADAFRTEEERAAAERLATELGRLVRDLEFNAGLNEPTQQTVVPPPAPWRPDPRADGRAAPVVDDVWPRGAPAAGGARVTIRGRNLRASQVMFGATAARIVRAEDDAVTVVAPAGSAGPVVISVTNDDGTYALSRVPFTYRR
ncbi:IPT/TIG domain-containing protein [Anaeromyxobacter oryzae]|uniref:IPT/TIG domain-containing protein n=1 Tax=Anaeromyxobacter oryzae TaxID=2918170 RepID=A0ABM7X2U6_9BACT|nr:IPT/TIG domain-containing protein [Anaeromyxobacter oryzae]BDG06106.1 hypothetical protein AMOR_51020 [Anaeromyxobacter oryzae]